MRTLQEKDRKMGKIVSENISMLCATKNRRSDRPKSEIAKRCEVSAPSVTAWVDGRIVPSVANLVIIAEYFGVTLDWLVTKHNFEEIDATKLLLDATKKGE